MGEYQKQMKKKKNKPKGNITTIRKPTHAIPHKSSKIFILFFNKTELKWN